ncbi:rhodanese-like domain-containing protein [Paraglaciecola polaris]|uniref:Rhodanese domain-containing protein n=1 Tax=Paraglaciecola polaris LMG 21857 TaxID=1129793 RepID=K6Z9Q4_9ALTE|nr:rhodanese-like domain-containing protein [Paraglaciecola polaris]GAC32846.1 hypothetical protein GPLA_1939 [Paraglaciecola polaris LMG 21857]|tara:strand:- start:4330 stop:4677 length:348 start_codon:yes stop_codon:yes gene_type:complete
MLKTIPQLMSEINPDILCLDCEAAASQRRQDNGLLVDVREPSEYAEASVPGALNFPRGLLEMKMLAHQSDESSPIYLHCASAVRAKLAAEQLMRIGYNKVYVITGELSDIIRAHS